jgi:tetratricopeptide (TPR) repeat protein
MISNTILSQMLAAILLLTFSTLGSTQCLTNRIDNVPLYGQPQVERSVEMKKLDDEFIARALAGMKTRERASDAWWAEGEDYVAKQNYDYAMRRYNQSWLLNPQNFKAYWGIARVLLECARVDESKVYFSKAISLVNDKYQEPALLTDAANAIVLAARRASDGDNKRAAFAEADALYARVLKVDPEYGNAYKRYAMSLYYQGSYADAWNNLREAEKRPNVGVPRAFVEALRRAMPEPAR